MTDLISTYSQMLASPLMQRALIIAVLVGLSAPVIGTYLVQRGLALLGDGIGHIALTDVTLGWIAGAAANVSPHDAWAIPGAIVVSIIGAILIEVIRAYGRTRGDVALAILFYGGIAGGVILIKLAGGTTTNLTSYLFGSIATVSVSDAWFAIALSAFILAVGIGLHYVTRKFEYLQSRICLIDRQFTHRTEVCQREGVARLEAAAHSQRKVVGKALVDLTDELYIREIVRNSSL